MLCGSVDIVRVLCHRRSRGRREGDCEQPHEPQADTARVAQSRGVGCHGPASRDSGATRTRLTAAGGSRVGRVAAAPGFGPRAVRSMGANVPQTSDCLLRIQHAVPESHDRRLRHGDAAARPPFGCGQRCCCRSCRARCVGELRPLAAPGLRQGLSVLPETKVTPRRIGSGAGIRTPIRAFKGRCPTIERRRSVQLALADSVSARNAQCKGPVAAASTAMCHRSDESASGR